MSDESTYSLYDQIPPLPVPTLEDTAQRYLASVAPLVDSATYAEVEAAMNAFTAPGGQGPRLQAALEQRAASSDNWLAEWWDDVAYLAYPEPVLINSNWGIWCDPRQPTDDPAMRAAEIAARTIDYYIELVNETLPPERAGKAQVPQDMSYCRRMFATTRVPGAVKDELVHYDAQAARHILVMRRHQIFTLQVLDDEGRCMSVAELARAFQNIRDLADQDGELEEPVGVLTTERRPVWAMERVRLLADSGNAETLAAIESAVFGVYFVEEAFDTFNAMARGGVHGSPGDRWMDKSFAYVVDERGRASHHGEHSVFDALQPIAAFDYACDKAMRGVFRNEAAETRLRDDRPQPVRRRWALGPESLAAIDAAIAHFEAKTEDLDLEILHFDSFGKDLIKTFKMGPDPFIQMSFQLAYHRLYQRFPKVYEAAATRGFKLGRTETIRSVTKESRAFVQTMSNPSASAGEKIAAARAAFDKHGQIAAEASNAQGVDRHLLGLKLIAAELGEEPAELFNQEIFTRGWELSTAQIPVKSMMQNTFGPVMFEGYGIGYVVRNEEMSCSVVCHASCPETSAKSFAQTIRAAMEDLRELLATEAG